jgi:hypothetical protein
MNLESGPGFCANNSTGVWLSAGPVSDWRTATAAGIYDWFVGIALCTTEPAIVEAADIPTLLDAMRDVQLAAYEAQHLHLARGGRHLDGAHGLGPHAAPQTCATPPEDRTARPPHPTTRELRR